MVKLNCAWADRFDANSALVSCSRIGCGKTYHTSCLKLSGPVGKVVMLQQDCMS